MGTISLADASQTSLPDSHFLWSNVKDKDNSLAVASQTSQPYPHFLWNKRIQKLNKSQDKLQSQLVDISKVFSSLHFML